MTIIPHKRCSKCGADKPLNQFHKQSRCSDGYRSTCKECRRLESKAYYWQDADTQRAKLRQRRESKPGYGKIALRQPYYCSRCNKTKTAVDFDIDRRRRFGHYPFCKECRKADLVRYSDKIRVSHRKYYERNRAACIARAELWVKTNPDKRRSIVRIHRHKRRAWKNASSGTFTYQEWISLCEYYDYRCLCCRKRAPDIRLTQDHIVPLSRGGSNTIDNIQPLCMTCNASKNARTIDYRGRW